MEINVEFLLGRTETILNTKNIQNQIFNKRILITGAAGSIGRELTKQIISCKPGQLCLVDQSEIGIYYLKSELGGYSQIIFELADITDKTRISAVFQNFKPQIVFHTAAYKHVSLMEDFPYEAIKNNVFGTKIVADLSQKNKVEKFIFISSDKAVKPTSVMGRTKRVAEIYVQNIKSKIKSRTQFIIARFGNVLGSTGSVFHNFKQQISIGGPVTITDKKASRYFMTISEAAQLLLEAAAIGKGGEVLVFDMGKPVAIYDLAKRMIKEADSNPANKIAIKFIGLANGEKLHEDLWHDGETTLPTDHSKISIACLTTSGRMNIEEKIQSLHKALARNKSDELLTILKEIIDEAPHPIFKQQRIPTSLLGNGTIQMNVTAIHVD